MAARGERLGGPRFGLPADSILYAPDTGATAGGDPVVDSLKFEIPEAFRFTIPEYREGQLLKDKGVLLTGVGRGIDNSLGPAIAREFGAQGARLVLTATEGSREQGESLVQELQGKGIEAYWLPADLTNPEAPARLIEETVNRFGRLDIVGSNHGVREDGSFMDLPDEAFDKLWQVKGMSNVRLFRAAFKQMRDQSPRGGVLIATSSIANEGSPGQAPYSMLNGATRSLVKTLSREGIYSKIRANVVSPGLVPGTEMTKPLTEKDEKRVLKLAGMPEGINTQDVALAYLYFAAETTGNLTGQEMQVLYRGQVQAA
ncbi:MAG: SDR family oxidoreductase [Candidatus Levybacteria bacterium]|nr:SDR family oxidoreductase [Candidatus Levybacteria bacterium]